jgi:hypothetical protein
MLEEVPSLAFDVVDLCQLWLMVETCALRSPWEVSPRLPAVDHDLDVDTFFELHRRMAGVADNTHLSRVLQETWGELAPHVVGVPDTAALVTAFQAGAVEECCALLARQVAEVQEQALRRLSP